jgi:hypothetical protein
MVFWLVIGCPLVVLLVIAFVMDRKSKRVRGMSVGCGPVAGCRTG